MSNEMEPLSVEARLIADLGVQVARLTHQVAFRDMIIKELKHEIKTERAAVVAFVRGARLDELADAIECGEHRREEEP
jgi:hypothetical protein